MRMFSRLMLAAWLVGAGSGLAAADGPGVEEFQPRSVVELRRIGLDSARERFEVMRGLDEAGEVTAGRLVVVSRRRMEAQLDVAAARSARVAAAKEHFARTRKILEREESFLVTSRCTNPDDIGTIKIALMEAEYRFAREREAADDGKGPTAEETIKLDRRYRQARADRDAAIEASDTRYEAEIRAGQPLGQAVEAHASRFQQGRAAFERDFGSDPRLYQYPPSLEAMKERDEARAIKP